MVLLTDKIDYSKQFKDASFSYLQICLRKVRKNIIEKVNLEPNTMDTGYAIMVSFRKLYEIHMYMCEIADREHDILLSEICERDDDDILFNIDNLVTVKLGKIWGKSIWFDFESADPRKNHDAWIWTID